MTRGPSRAVPAGWPVAAIATLAAIVLVVRGAMLLPPSAVPLGPDVLAAGLFLAASLLPGRSGAVPAWLRPAGLLRCAAVFALLLGAGALAFLLYERMPGAPHPGPPPAGLSFPGGFVLHQVALVALPEEFFFRGALYDAFEERGREPVLPTSVLFALGHLAIHATPYRALTFFPALLFGWGRRICGNVYVPVLLHAAFNLIPSLAGAGR